MYTKISQFAALTFSSVVVLPFIAAPVMAGADYPVKIQSCDRQVVFDKAPERAISNDVNLTEMMLVLGLQQNMVGYTGISGWKTLDEKIRKDIEALPELSPRYPSKEVLVSAGADFFFAGWNYGMKVGGPVTPQSLKPFGIKVYELAESCIHIMKKQKASMDDLYVDLRNLGKIFGVSNKAENLISGYQAKLAEYQQRIPAGQKPLNVFVYDSGQDKFFTSGAFGMPTAMIEAAGGHNIMDDVDSSWVKVGVEDVVARQPEVIVIVNYGDVTAAQKREFLMQHPAFKGVPAIENDRFVTLEYVEATPGPRNIDAINRLISAFYQ